jgi:signal transduction histidine kinase
VRRHRHHRNVTVRNNQAANSPGPATTLRQAGSGRVRGLGRHELRTPLDALPGLTELLLADPDLGETAHAMAAAAHGQGENLRRLVDDLLDLSRIESGRLVLERVPFDPVQVVREVCAALAQRAAEHDLELHVHVPDPHAQATDEPELAPLVLGDPGRFRQVITNLVANAVKFTDAGSIDVTVGPGPMLAGSVQVAWPTPASA